MSGVQGRIGKLMRQCPRLVAAAALTLLAFAGCHSSLPGPAPPSGASPAATSSTSAATSGHVFVINLENKSYLRTWGPASVAPYLSGTLRAQGVLLSQYYGIAHHSTPNYLAQISGQGPNPVTKNDCPAYVPFEPFGTTSPGQLEGSGCVYPASVPTVAGQLTTAGKTWKAYIEDMQTPCEHPELWAKDDHRTAKVGDQYATYHDPFVYFESITSSPQCQSSVVPFSQFAEDLESIRTTPNLSYISPNLCDDGHDSPCVDGRPGGLASADVWLRQQVPAILASPAFKQDGVLVITFDEADGTTAGPDGLLPGGTAGGRVGALVLSPFTLGGTTSDTPYNHYSLLATIEDLFSLPRLGYASAPGLKAFGPDVFSNKP